MGFGLDAGQLFEPHRSRWDGRNAMVTTPFQGPVNTDFINKEHLRPSLRGLDGEFWAAGGPMPIAHPCHFTWRLWITE